MFIYLKKFIKKSDNIEFTFEMLNTNNIILAIGMALVIISALILIIKYLMGTKHRMYMKKNQ